MKKMKISWITFLALLILGTLGLGAFFHFNDGLKAPMDSCFEKSLTGGICYGQTSLEAGQNSQLPSSNNATNSGPTSVFPWEENESFKKARLNCGTINLLAGYETILKDPLPGEEENVHLAARMLAGTVVYPNRIFSQNAKIGPYSIGRGFGKGPTYLGSRLSTTVGGGVCKIASTLYNVSVLSGMKVIERHAHGMPVPYVPYGQDATVAYGTKDFKFQNTSDSPVLIWAEGVENTLYMAFYGGDPPPEIKWNHQFLEIYKAGAIYKHNPQLKPGMEKVLQEGMDGAKVRSFIETEDKNGNVIIRKMGTSYYRPLHFLIEKNR